MNFELSPEKFRTMIFYDCKIALTSKDCHASLVQAWGGGGTTHFSTTHSLITFGNFNAINLVLLVQVVLQHLLLNKQLMLDEKQLKMTLIQRINKYRPYYASLPRQSIHHYLNLRKVCATYTNR